MQSGIKKELEYIIEQEQIKSVFQPIISLRDGEVMGHEALSRILCQSVIPSTEELFQLAGEHNCLWDLELLCRVKSMEAAYILMKPPYDKKLFINVNPKIMHDIKFKNGFTKEYLKKFDITPENIIFEITERDAIKDMKSFQNVVEHYKSQQYQIAIDDAGAGYSGLNLISDIHPHFLKLDMKLIRNIDKDRLKYALVKSMIELSYIADISLIAEGIETKEELKTLINLGVQYGQGYYIQKPSEDIKEIEPNLIEYIKDLNRKKYHVHGTNLSEILIDHITTPMPAIDPKLKVEEVFEKFQKDSNIYSMCVVNDGRVLGIITRENLMLKLSGRYGFCLNQKKEITAIMDTEFLKVDYHTPVSTVCYLAMDRDNSKLYDALVITKNDKYYGTVTVKDLLQKTTEMDIINAKNQNPLSGLPGNTIIEQEMLQCINKKDNFSILYIDIDNFKAYNDVYGFEKGDMVIKNLALLLMKYTNKEDFTGHIGGDDFIIILDHYNWKSTVESIMKEFKEKSLHLYRAKDIESGFIIATNRHGEIEQFPLISITIAVVTNEKVKYKDIYELSEELARLKKKGKLQKGNFCCIQ